MPFISARTTAVPLSPFRKWAALAEAAKARGTTVFHLNIGQPDILTPPAALARLQQELPAILAYSPAEGWASTRQQYAAAWQAEGLAVDSSQVVLTTGASEGLQLLFYTCFAPGDEVIIPEPFYANYNGFAQIAGVVVRPVTCRLEAGFALPAVAEFAAAIGPRTRGILLTNPSNPTGAIYTQTQLRALAELVKERDLFLLVDEVYRDFCYDEQVFFSALALPDLEKNVVVIDSVSKRFSACGARIGMLVSRNPAVLEGVNRYAMLRLSPPGLGQLLTEALLATPPSYLAEIKADYDQRRRVVFRHLQHMPGVKCYLPGGAFYCFAQFPIDSAERFCRWLLEDFSYAGATVMLSPGAAFYATPGMGEQEVRIAYILAPAILEQAMVCLAAALQSYPGRTETVTQPRLESIPDASRK